MSSRGSETVDDAYAALGVCAFINCCGTRTIHGGSIMVPAALAAMNAAATRFVNIEELMAAAGQRIADLTRAPAAIVTSGAAAALAHGTAACIAGADPERMLRLPDTSGVENRVLMLSSHRFTYDHAIRATGARIVEVGGRDELTAALAAGAAMIAVLGNREHVGEVRLAEMAELARPHGIPILVDAASESLCRPELYLAAGASLVAYSGGKYLRGPQPTGLLLGERDLVQSAWCNAAPHHAFGRAMKIGKEEIMGVLAAVEHWAAQRDPEQEYRECAAELQKIAREVGRMSGIETRTIEPSAPGDRVPVLEICWAGTGRGLGGLALRERLLAGEPRIMLDDRGATETSVRIIPSSLQPGEARIVGERIRAALEAAPPGSRPPDRPAEVDLGGRWEVDIAFVRGNAIHGFTLVQREARITGHHRTLHLDNSLEGTVRGCEVELTSEHRYEGTNLSYRFTGRLADGNLEGTVALGSCGTSAPGPINRREYGNARWTGRRCT